MTHISLKVLILGSENVGEINFKKIVDRYFKTDYKKIVGVNVLSKSISIKLKERHVTALVSLWDISSKSRFEEIRKLFYAGGTGAFFVFDLSKPSTWYNIIEFYKEVEFEVQKIPFVVVANLDLKKEKAINTDDVQKWTEDHHGAFVLIEPDDFSLLESTFLNLIEKIIVSHY